MATYAELNQSSVCFHVCVKNPPPENMTNFILLADGADPSDYLGYTYSGGNWTPPAPAYRKVLTGAEWVDTWDSTEWASLKAFRKNGTAKGDTLDHFMDAIQLTMSLNLESPRAVQFYDWLVSEGFVTQARADELQQGILE